MARGSHGHSSSNGGIMGSGIFGFFGTTIHCNSTDNSMYCNIMKLFNLLIILTVVFYIMYLAYYFFIQPAMKRRR